MPITREQVEALPTYGVKGRPYLRRSDVLALVETAGGGADVASKTTTGSERESAGEIPEYDSRSATPLPEVSEAMVRSALVAYGKERGEVFFDEGPASLLHTTAMKSALVAALSASRGGAK